MRGILIYGTKSSRAYNLELNLRLAVLGNHLSSDMMDGNKMVTFFGQTVSKHGHLLPHKINPRSVTGLPSTDYRVVGSGADDPQRGAMLVEALDECEDVIVYLMETPEIGWTRPPVRNIRGEPTFVRFGEEEEVFLWIYKELAKDRNALPPTNYDSQFLEKSLVHNPYLDIDISFLKKSRKVVDHIYMTKKMITLEGVDMLQKLLEGEVMLNRLINELTTAREAVSVEEKE